MAIICAVAGTLVCGGSLVSLSALALLDYTLLWLRRFVQLGAWAYVLAAWHPWAHCSCVCLVVWCAFCVFLCCALCFWTLVPLLLSHTFLVSWRLPPMRAGDVRAAVGVLSCLGNDGRALLIVTARLLWCFFPRALRTPVPSLC